MFDIILYFRLEILNYSFIKAHNNNSPKFPADVSVQLTNVSPYKGHHTYNSFFFLGRNLGVLAEEDSEEEEVDEGQKREVSFTDKNTSRI